MLAPNQGLTTPKILCTDLNTTIHTVSMHSEVMNTESNVLNLSNNIYTIDTNIVLPI